MSDPRLIYRCERRFLTALVGIGVLLGTVTAPAVTSDAVPLSPPIDGQPYTRSARIAALAKISGSIAVFAGSRYAYVRGFKVRLDDENWRDEAQLRDGLVYVPEGFAGLVTLAEIRPEPAPTYLVERWVYRFARPRATLPAGVRRLEIAGHPYVALADLAAAARMAISSPRRGLTLVGASPVSIGEDERNLSDGIVTLFDTPEKFADPAIATNSIPALKRQGAWTEHVRVSAEQRAVLEGPETNWPTASKADYDLTGFDATLLGSAVPAPGVYPRVLFSAADVPLLAARVKGTKAGQMALIEMEHLFRKSWWDPAASDGRIFAKLASGETATLEWDVAPGTPPSDYPQQFKGEKPGIHNSHVAYVPECLTAMALYCLLTGDSLHGRQAAAAIANYYKLREPLLDEWSALSDAEFGSTVTRTDGTVARAAGAGASTHWRPVHGIMAHMDLGLSLDFAGMWMTASEKETMRRIIAKATYGRRAYGQDAPVRFRDVNWVTWDLPQFLALAAIEGLEGFDREAYDSNRETVRAFCDWGIDDAGVIYESNGKTPGGLQFQLLSMVALARRGENLFGHPHWRKLLQAQLQMTSPSGLVVVNSGTQYVPFSRQHLSFEIVDEFKCFYPGERVADYLLGQAKTMAAADPGAGASDGLREWILDDFTPEGFRAKVGSLPGLRLPSVTYPGFVHGVLYDADFQPTTRAQVNRPLDFIAPVHGAFSSFSDATPRATWIDMLVRPDHYLGAGHHHADAGMVHFSALGVDWFTQSPYSQAYDGRMYNLVQVDGHSEAESIPGFANGYNAAAAWLGASSRDDGAFASADLTCAYSWRWLTQPPQVWNGPGAELPWEMEPSPENLRIFAGTARYKLRPWWANYTYSNFIATCRAPFNPMQYVFRSVALIRGAHPYGLVIDDLKKDMQPHQYQWVAMLNGGVWRAQVPGLPAGWCALASADDGQAQFGQERPALTPRSGEPLLMVVPLGENPVAPIVESLHDGPKDRQGVAGSYDRLSIERQAIAVGFKVLLVPLTMGEPLPRITWDPVTATAWIDQAGKSDLLIFTAGSDQRTRASVQREGRTLIDMR